MASGTLDLTRASTLGGSITGNSVLRFSSGTHNLNGLSIAGTATVQVNGSSALVSTTGAGATVAVGGTLQLTSGTLGGAGPLTANGTLDWAGGTITGIGGLTVNGSLTIGRTGSVTLDGRNLTSIGMSTWSSNRIYLRNNAVWANMGTFEIQTDSTLDLGDSSTPQFMNAGTVRKTALTGTTTIDVSFNTSGTVSAESGWINFTRGFVQTAGETILGGGNLATTTTLDIQGGALSGVGTINGNVSMGARRFPEGCRSKDGHAERGCASGFDPNAYADSHIHRDTLRDGDSDGHTDEHQHADENAHPNSHDHANAERNADTDSHTNEQHQPQQTPPRERQRKHTVRCGAVPGQWQPRSKLRQRWYG